jgi:hypothetical protein
MNNLIQDEGGFQVDRGWLLPACSSDACKQGKHDCPCPSACLQPDTPKDAIPWPISLLIAAVAVAGVVTAAVWG